MRARFIYEKFKQDSDPIADLNIGILNTKRDFKSMEEALKYFIEYCIAAVLKKDEIPKDILGQVSKFINTKYYYKLNAWFDQHITINGHLQSFNPLELGYKLYRKKFKVACPSSLEHYHKKDIKKHVKHVKQK